jgi:HlyD family secretion protein
MNRRLAAAIAVSMILAVTAWIAISGGRTAASAQEVEQATNAQVATVKDQVVADGRVTPAQEAALSLPIGGIVAEVLVAEGDRVEAGQVLMRLDATRQRAAAVQAEAQLQRAQARLDELQAGARPEEIAAAQAALDAAIAAFERTRQGADEAQIITARAQLANAEATLRQAQAAYDQVSWRNDIGALPQAAQLEQATNAYQAARAQLDDLLKGPNAADVEAAAARVRQAQAQLDLTRAGARPETIAAAQADVAVASAALEQALAALAETELRAPFAGTVAALNTKVGEQVAAGAPIVRLADFSTWRIETEDLTEIDIVAVREGSRATVVFDAIPDLELPATVMRIRPIGENKQGDITYTAILALEQQDPRLRWNMTASVTISSD